MKSFSVIRLTLAAVGIASSVALHAQTGAAHPAPPSMILGQFADDYDGHFTITDSTFNQGARPYHITKWNVAEQYFIAWFVPSKSSAASLWIRVDWLPLPGMAPYDWGMCMSAYDAPTADSAEATHVVNRATPRTGCNKYPFSRMKREGH